MQTIIGANGVIANLLARELTKYTAELRLVSRNPRRVNPTDQLLAADITDYEQTCRAVEGSEVVYLVVGLTYNIKVWESTWPVIMRNVIDACKKYHTRLLFFDNVYLYGRVDGWMTEKSPVNPCSKKGEVRAKIAGMLMDEMKQGNLDVLIARAADFYGPNTPLSFINIMVLENLKKGKKAQLLARADTLHSLTYTPDAGKATAILGNTASAFNQVWHLPTHRKVINGEQFVKLTADALGVKPRYMVIGKGMLRLIGLFNDIIKESVEMIYQNEYDYLFDSHKFEREFHFTPATYPDGIASTAKSLTR